MIDLKPCPFCGQKSATILSDEIDFVGSMLYSVMCENCCCTGHYTSRDLAVESWIFTAWEKVKVRWKTMKI